MKAAVWEGRRVFCFDVWTLWWASAEGNYKAWASRQGRTGRPSRVRSTAMSGMRPPGFPAAHVFRTQGQVQEWEKGGLAGLYRL